MKMVGIIPCRYNSSRFPGKALAILGDKPVLQHVVESASRYEWDHLIVATDDTRIESFCKTIGVDSVMTSEKHKDCLDRACEAAVLLGSISNPNNRYVVIQGDEPFFKPEILDCDLSPEIVNFYTRVSRTEEIDDPNVVKVVVSKQLKAIYYSRYSIPYSNSSTVKSSDKKVIDKQIGVYSFSGNMLVEFKNLGMSYLEGLEGIGLLRFLENGIPIDMRYAYYDPISIDTPGDLERANLVLSGG